MSDNRVTITIKLTPGKDDDLIRWWGSLPTGSFNGAGDSRQHTIKTLLRKALRMKTPAPAMPPDDAALQAKLEALESVGELREWMQQIADDIPVYVQTEISKAMYSGVAPHVSAFEPIDDIATVASTEELAQRRAKLKQAKW